MPGVRGGVVVALGAALVGAIIAGAYSLEDGLATAGILFVVGILTVVATHAVVDRRERLGGVRRQALVVGVLAFAPLVITLGLFVDLMYVSPHDALFTTLVVAFGVALGLWAGRLLLRRIMEQSEREREAAEAARRSLIAAVSHDLRTPVTALRLLAEAVDDEIGDPETRREYVRRLGVHVRALGVLIDDLFELTRLEAGQVAWTVQQVHLDELVAETVEAMQPAAAAGGVSVRAEIDPALGPACANPERIQRVLFNLIQNAIRHTPADGSVTVRATPGRDGIEVEVTDTGEGIPVGDRERLFEAFQQGAGRQARTDGSAGLGLAISRAIVEAHGGDIWIDDPGADGGARVRFRLPVAA